MEGFLTRKRPRVSPLPVLPDGNEDTEGESTEFKLALLASLHPYLDDGVLIEALLESNGSVEEASASLLPKIEASPRKRIKTIGHQTSLSNLIKPSSHSHSSTTPFPLTKRGKTLYLYSPADIERQTPCTIIHNFLPAAEADALLLELLLSLIHI